MAFFIGIDIGGTFTDCAVLDYAGRIVTIAKTPTRRGDPDRGVMEAVAAAARRMAIEPQQLLQRVPRSSFTDARSLRTPSSSVRAFAPHC